MDGTIIRMRREKGGSRSRRKGFINVVKNNEGFANREMSVKKNRDLLINRVRFE